MNGSGDGGCLRKEDDGERFLADGENEDGSYGVRGGNEDGGGVGFFDAVFWSWKFMPMKG